MNERDYHDHHYQSEAARILESPIFTRVHDRAAGEFLRRTGTGRAHRILSLGCGDGSLERRLAPHTGEIVGIDISAVAIEQAQTKSRAAGLGNLSFLVSDTATGSLERLGQFDVIAAFAFLHHLDDATIRDTLLAGRKALRSGGVFYSTDPSRRRLVGRFAGLVRRTYDRYHSPGERELDPEALASFAAAAGLSQPQIAYTDYALGPIAWLAPGTPRWLIPTLEALDNLALSAPLINRYASSFSLLARAP